MQGLAAAPSSPSHLRNCSSAAAAEFGGDCSQDEELSVLRFSWGESCTSPHWQLGWIRTSVLGCSVPESPDKIYFVFAHRGIGGLLSHSFLRAKPGQLGLAWRLLQTAAPHRLQKFLTVGARHFLARNTLDFLPFDLQFSGHQSFLKARSFLPGTV